MLTEAKNYLVLKIHCHEKVSCFPVRRSRALTETPPPPSDTALYCRFFQRVTEVAGALRWVVFIPLNAPHPSPTCCE